MSDVLHVPGSFNWSVLAAELVAALNECVKTRGLPSMARMQGVPTRDEAERLREELEKNIARAERSWNKAGRVRLFTSVKAGKSEAKGYDVSITVESRESKSRPVSTGD